LEQLLQLIVKLTQQLMQGIGSFAGRVFLDFIQKDGSIAQAGEGEAHMIGGIPYGRAHNAPPFFVTVSEASSARGFAAVTGVAKAAATSVRPGRNRKAAAREGRGAIVMRAPKGFAGTLPHDSQLGVGRFVPNQISGTDTQPPQLPQVPITMISSLDSPASDDLR
jgi:hypothetical protein